MVLVYIYLLDPFFKRLKLYFMFKNEISPIYYSQQRMWWHFLIYIIILDYHVGKKNSTHWSSSKKRRRRKTQRVSIVLVWCLSNACSLSENESVNTMFLDEASTLAS